jgi:hypothetical protein
MRYPLGWLVCEINIDIDVDKNKNCMQLPLRFITLKILGKYVIHDVLHNLFLLSSCKI